MLTQVSERMGVAARALHFLPAHPPPALGVADQPGQLQTHVLLFQAIERLLRDSHLADQVRHRNPYLSLLQDCYDLLHRKALPSHGKSPFPTPTILTETHSQTGLNIPEPLRTASELLVALKTKVVLGNELLVKAII